MLKSKKFISFVFLSLLSISFLYAGGNRVNTYSLDGDRAFRVELKANSTTGYMWDCKVDNEKVVKLRKGGYIPFDERNRGSKNIYGAGGIAYFEFDTVGEGEAKATFVYQRPWEKENGENLAEKLVVNVKVGKDGKICAMGQEHNMSQRDKNGYFQTSSYSYNSNYSNN